MKPRAPQYKKKGKENSQHGQHPQGRFKDPVGAAVIQVGQVLRHQLGNSDGDPRRGNSQQRRVHGVGHLVEADAFVPQDGPQEYTQPGAEQAYAQAGGREYECTFHK